MKKLLTLTTGIIVTAQLFGGAAIGKPRDGTVYKPDSQQGKVVFVNAQSKAQEEWIKSCTDYISEFLRFKTEVAKGSFDLTNPKISGNATVFIVSNPDLPMALYAPESRWAMINVESLAKDTKPHFFEARVKKAVIRAFSFVCGGSDSQYAHSIMSSVLKPEDFDKIIDSQFTIDVALKAAKNAEKLGLKQARYLPYRRACEEGWAPAPTNDVQKAIWDKVHTIPKNPIKIEFDPKKGK